MKVKLEQQHLNTLFESLNEHGYTTSNVAVFLGKNRRTVADWKRGKFNMSAQDFQKLVHVARIGSEQLKPIYIDEDIRKRIIGRIGGKAQWEKNGSIGTREDRIKVGKASYEARKENINDIFSRKIITKPKISSKLAEFVGISMGDGSITNYQLTISLNSIDDAEYIEYVAGLGWELFGIAPRISKLNRSNCTNLIFSSVELINYLLDKGLPKGDKIRANLDIPIWIRCDTELVSSCLRGLFDTDGSVFQETHRIMDKNYSYPRLSFVSASESLRTSVCDTFIELGINAKIRNNRSVNIERFTDIEKYFRIIGSSNPKHLLRIARFGGVG